jgi:hypothetical protein
VAVAERLNLVLLGQPQDVPAEPLEPETSPHTGNRLRRMHVSFRVVAEESATLSETLANARGTENALEATDGSRWVVSECSYSYQEGDRVHRHSAELREVEELRAERLELLGLSLTPTRYKEEFRDGGILIVARVDPDLETDDVLERELTTERDDLYFDILRVGVSDKPVRMRFARCLWQNTEGGRAHLLRFVSEAGDDEETQRGLMWFQPELRHLERKAAAAEEAIEALLGELQMAHVLSESAVSAVRRKVDEAWNARAREFDEASDINLHF